jgi:RES domain
MSLDPMASWAEFIRREEIHDVDQLKEARRNLWRVTVEETEIADLSSFAKIESCGLDAEVAVGGFSASHALADDLCEAGYRGLLAPSAALPGAVNLTVFGERYEVEIATGEHAPGNPDPSLWFPVVLVASNARPPRQALALASHRGESHRGLEEWRASLGSA